MDDDRSDLITRWWTPAMDTARADVQRVLAGEKGFGQLDLRTPDGLADVRGFQFGDPRGLADMVLTPDVVNALAGHTRIHDAGIDGVDFSHAAMRLWEMTNVELTRCRFHAADLTGLRIWQSDVTGCDLSHANLRDSSLGGMRGGRPTIWTGCDFTGAHLARADFSEGDIYESTFEAARLDGALLRRVTMQDCRFAGLLTDVTIDGSAPAPGEQDVQQEWWLDDVNLSGCLFENSSITGYRLDTVRLPADPAALDGLTVDEPGSTSEPAAASSRHVAGDWPPSTGPQQVTAEGPQDLTIDDPWELDGASDGATPPDGTPASLPGWLAWIDTLPHSPRNRGVRLLVALLLVLLFVVPASLLVALLPDGPARWAGRLATVLGVCWAVLVLLWGERRRPPGARRLR